MPVAHLDELDPFADPGRFLSIRQTCALAGVPDLALGLFEAGLSDAEATRRLALECRARSCSSWPRSQPPTPRWRRCHRSFPPRPPTDPRTSRRDTSTP